MQDCLDRLRYPLIGFFHRLYPRRIGTRKLLPFYLNHHHLLGEGAEIGVQRGAFSEHILRYWKGRCLHCVDPWGYLGPVDYSEPNEAASVRDREFHQACHDETVARLKPFGLRAKLHRTTSTEAAGKFADGSLDFAFIDARHDYESVKADIAAWHPKIRKNGLLSGHDWSLDYGPPYYGVKKAVTEFESRAGLKLLVSADLESWFIPNTTDKT